MENKNLTTREVFKNQNSGMIYSVLLPEFSVFINFVRKKTTLQGIKFLEQQEMLYLLLIEHTVILREIPKRLC